ncbi:glycoside hydrolase family 2 protein [Labedella endophytica]|uniref:beta-mannosidase n=1 Tax=Labedella endophytica TaxID=1523160 RepID=A0A3S0VIL5_9MICO|nr:glycoside hydrolase family 2 protein [Labedella endophytica]RUR03393.1 glycoside hydrolase family 2 protein [Labedella endophytica]
MTFTSLATAGGATWTLTASAGPIDDAVAGREVPATVPGEVQLDLLAAGLIGDPFDGDNEKVQEWIGYSDWRYRTSFDWVPTGDDRHDLVADGLDTAATITLNGTVVASTANQHRSYRFDVGALLREGANELVVDFRSPIEFAREQEQILGALPTVMHHPFNAVRKMASNFGWDWGIDVSSSGIVKRIGIDSWSGVRIAAVRPLVDVPDVIPGARTGTGVLTAHVDLDWAGALDSAEVEVTVAGASGSASVASGQTTATVVVEAGDVPLWYPRGYGEQPLHEVEVSVGGARWESRVGFRTVALDTAPDVFGTPFTIAVNGQPVYAKGANWIPGDPFLTRMTPERYRASVVDAVESGMNILRIWGGGVYESDEFYDVCDELGVMVWQDFLFACAAYSEEDPLRSEVEAEARENVTRLSSHASLVMWNGCNENIWGYLEWDWRRKIGDRTWGEGYYTEILPGIVAELDPTRPYSPGSPFSFTHWAHPNDERHGTMHIWTVWNDLDYDEYRSYRPRFASEYGFQGPPAWSTLADVVHDDPIDPYGPQMLVHQKAYEGNAKLERGLGAHLPHWRSIDEWHWATQLNQARAVAFGIEHFRSLYPLNTGSIIWQLNDEWPVISWAAVDVHGHRKPLWFALRRAYADRLLTFQPRDGALELVAHNDHGSDWTESLSVSRRRLDGSVLAEHEVSLDIEARGIVAVELPAELTTAGDPRSEYLVVGTAGGPRAFGYLVEDTELALVAPVDALAVEVAATSSGATVTITASSLVKDLVLQVDRVDPSARVDDGLVTLEAGESRIFTVTGAVGDAAWSGFPLLSSVNDLVTG